MPYTVAVDALQYGFRPIVAREAVGDRNPDAHEANLYDVDAKYGDVVPVQEVLEYLWTGGAAQRPRGDGLASAT
jgi:maleamate amidohydrolase